MKRKSNSKNRPSEFVKLFANILNYGLANHTHKRIFGVMYEKSNNAKRINPFFIFKILINISLS